MKKRRSRRRKPRTKIKLVVKKARTIKAKKRQIGKSNTKRDKLFKAKKPGKRISRSGRIYYEYRKNRSDLKGRV